MVFFFADQMEFVMDEKLESYYLRTYELEWSAYHQN
jgi:hypothetical protein